MLPPLLGSFTGIQDPFCETPIDIWSVISVMASLTSSQSITFSSMDLDERRRRLGKNIQRARMARGISQRSFAHMIGVSQAYLSAVENGTRSIGFNNLCKIAEGLETTIGELADVFEAETPPTSTMSVSSQTSQGSRPKK